MPDVSSEPFGNHYNFNNSGSLSLHCSNPLSIPPSHLPHIYLLQAKAVLSASKRWLSRELALSLCVVAFMPIYTTPFDGGTFGRGTACIWKGLIQNKLVVFHLKYTVLVTKDMPGMINLIINFLEMCVSNTYFHICSTFTTLVVFIQTHQLAQPLC